jgi:septal ring factor EnvC (AmiA/AmiB activator)
MNQIPKADSQRISYLKAAFNKYFRCQRTASVGMDKIHAVCKKEGINKEEAFQYLSSDDKYSIDSSQNPPLVRGIKLKAQVNIEDDDFDNLTKVDYQEIVRSLEVLTDENETVKEENLALRERIVEIEQSGDQEKVSALLEKLDDYKKALRVAQDEKSELDTYTDELESAFDELKKENKSLNKKLTTAEKTVNRMKQQIERGRSVKSPIRSSPKRR